MEITANSNPARDIAVVGGGYWGQNLVRNFAQLGALRRICDSSQDTLTRMASMYPDAINSTEISDVLEDDKIKGVVIAVPASAHYNLAKDALLAGKNVFVEKPLALDVQQARELIVLAERCKRTLMVGHLLEYHPAVVELNRLAREGKLGEIRYIHSCRLNFGKIRTEENVLWSFAPHDISAMLLLLNSMPSDITARGASFLQPSIPDVVLASMNFGARTKTSLHVSWLHPYKEQKLVVVGDRKMAVFDDVSKDKLVLFDHHVAWQEGKPIPQPGKGTPVDLRNDEPLKLECQDFLGSVRTGSKPRVDGRKGLMVLEVLAACQKSIDLNGEVIRMDQQVMNQ